LALGAGPQERKRRRLADAVDLRRRGLAGSGRALVLEQFEQGGDRFGVGIDPAGEFIDCVLAGLLVGALEGGDELGPLGGGPVGGGGVGPGAARPRRLLLRAPDGEGEYRGQGRDGAHGAFGGGERRKPGTRSRASALMLPRRPPVGSGAPMVL